MMTFAEPGQTGWHHVNCQPAEYWIEKVTPLGFRFDEELTKSARQVAATGHFAKRGLVFVRCHEEPEAYHRLILAPQLTRADVATSKSIMLLIVRADGGLSVWPDWRAVAVFNCFNRETALSVIA